MGSYRGVVYSPDAEAQLEALVDGDIRYQAEPAKFEHILQRDPELLSVPVTIDGKLVYVFITVHKQNSPTRLAITYRLLRDEGLVQIIDIRPYAK
jgi:hypothetical protein